MLELSIIISLTVLFIHACFWDGMIFESIYYKLYNLPRWVKKPLFDCPICMSPWYGSILIIIFGLLTGYYPHWYVWLLELFVAGGLNTLFAVFINYTRSAKRKCNCGTSKLDDIVNKIKQADES